MRASAEWRFFGALWCASPRATALWWGLIVLRGALPAAFALAMGALVTAVNDGDPLAGGLLAVGLVFIAMQALVPVHDAVSDNLGAVTSNWLHDRLHEACDGPDGLAHLDDPALADRLASARDFDMGLAGPNITVCMPNIGAGFATMAGGLAQALLLAGYRWWAPLLVGGAWASTHHFLKGGAIWRLRTSDEVAEQIRRADYAYRLAVEAPAAKELRLFGLADWVVGGFTTLRRELFDRSWAGAPPRLAADVVGDRAHHRSQRRVLLVARS